MAESVSWEYDYTTEPWLRWLVRAGAASVVGAYFGMLAMGGFSVLVLLIGGDPALKLLVVVLALVGGPFSLLYLWPMLRDADQRPAPFSGRERRTPLREWLVAGVVGLVVLAGAMVIEPVLAGGLFVCGLLAGAVGVLCSTRGTIDPEASTMERSHREWGLSRVTGYDTRRVGPLVVISLDASGPGSFGTVPSRVAVPATVAGDVTAALDAVVETDRETEGRDPNAAVRVVAVLFASLFAGGGLIGAVSLDRLGWYVGLIGLLFAGIFLLVAREG
jgi:hypothetical protein